MKHWVNVSNDKGEFLMEYTKAFNTLPEAQKYRKQLEAWAKGRYGIAKIQGGE